MREESREIELRQERQDKKITRTAIWLIVIGLIVILIGMYFSPYLGLAIAVIWIIVAVKINKLYFNK